MTTPFQKKSFVSRLFAYVKIWVTDRDARNYNIDAQRTLEAAGGERRWLLRYTLYHMFNMSLGFSPSKLKEDTVVSYINLLAKDPSHVMRGVQFKFLKGQFWKLGAEFCQKQYPQQKIRKALQDALYQEQQWLKPLAIDSWERRQRNVVVGYIQAALDMFDQKPNPPSAENRQRRRARQRRDRGGPQQ